MPRLLTIPTGTTVRVATPWHPELDSITGVLGHATGIPGLGGQGFTLTDTTGEEWNLSRYADAEIVTPPPTAEREVGVELVPPANLRADDYLVDSITGQLFPVIAIDENQIYVDVTPAPRDTPRSRAQVRDGLPMVRLYGRDETRPVRRAVLPTP